MGFWVSGLAWQGAHWNLEAWPVSLSSGAWIITGGSHTGVMKQVGEAVREAAQFYKVPPENILVIYDDVSLPVGKIRVRPTGSAGGHNGIKNIIAHLNTQNFPRVKIGAGAPPEAEDMINWVIGVPSQEEKKVLLESFQRAAQAAESIIRSGCTKAMNDFN